LYNKLLIDLIETVHGDRRVQLDNINAILNSIPSQVAVLDAGGTILHVNDAWSSFARDNGAADTLVNGVGTNYLEVCQSAAAPKAGEAPVAYQGIRSVLSGERMTFDLEYPCHSPKEKRWFLMTVSPFKGTSGGAVISHVNITERKLAEMRRAGFDRILESSLNEIYIFDAETLFFVEVNEGARLNLGYTLDELQTMITVDITPDHTKETFAALVSPLLNGQDKIVFNTVYRRKDGSDYSVEVHLQHMMYGDRQVYVAIIHDITERQRAEERATGLGNVLEASINEIMMFDEESLRFVYANQAARNNLCYSMDELGALTPIDIKPEFTRETFEATLEPLRSNKKRIVDFTTVHRRKDGSIYPVEVHLQRSILDSKPVFAQIMLDITERTQTEESLSQARWFLESAPDATVILNSEGRIEVANTQTVKLLGYTPDELRGMSVDILVPERLRDGHVAHRESFTADPRVRSIGVALGLFAVTKDGREMPIEVSLSPIKTSDGILVAAAIRDVTERKEVSEALQRAKETAESATATKTRFLAAASHDLRQPLQSIGLYLSVLNLKLVKPENLAICDKIRNSLEVMGELLDALLDISKLDSGSITPTKKDFSIQTMFDHLLAISGPHASEKGLVFRCESSSCLVHSDPALLQRVVENFVSNAIRYTDSGSVDVRCEIRDDHARIEVKDSGAGIPEEALETIFEEYFQLDNPVRDRRKGLGLGLSIVKHIARLLDHPLNVASVPGEGSTFAVHVPLGQLIERAAKGRAPEKESIQTERQPIVLFVDDDSAIVDATTMLLNISGFQVHSALSGDEAMAHLTNGVYPDIVVSDFRLPGYNGVELIRRVRQATVNDLPAVLMTGDTSAKEIVKTSLGNCTVLHKPADTDRLTSLIKTLTT
jgi:PAS domain S-box-containing protein